MKRFVISLLAFALGCAAAFAQEVCTHATCAAAEKRAEDIAKICKLDAEQQAQVLALNEQLANQAAEVKRCYSPENKKFKKGMKSAEKTYNKALKKLIGAKNVRIVKGCDKVEQKAIALAEKQKSKQSE